MSMQKKKSILVAAHFELVLFTVDFSEEKGNWTRAEVFLSRIKKKLFTRFLSTAIFILERELLNKLSEEDTKYSAACFRIAR